MRTDVILYLDRMDYFVKYHILTGIHMEIGAGGSEKTFIKKRAFLETRQDILTGRSVVAGSIKLKALRLTSRKL